MTMKFWMGFLLTLMLTIVPLPDVLAAIRPPWVLLLLLYFQLFIPEHFNLSIVFSLGLALDALFASILGQHVFALVFTTWLISGKVRRFRFFPLGQQMGLIAIFCFVYQGFIDLTDAFFGFHYNFLAAAGSAVLSMILWPWLKLVADSFYLTKKIHKI